MFDSLDNFDDAQSNRSNGSPFGKRLKGDKLTVNTWNNTDTASESESLNITMPAKSMVTLTRLNDASLVANGDFETGDGKTGWNCAGVNPSKMPTIETTGGPAGTLK